MRVFVLGGTGSIGAPVVRALVGRGHRVTTEETPFDPLPAFAWMVKIVAERGEWARGYALDQSMSGGKARRELGWEPRHLDPEAEIRALP